jgi:hypothetical protein
MYSQPSLYSPFPLTLALCGDDDFDAVQPIVSDAATAIDVQSSFVSFNFCVSKYVLSMHF